MKNYIKAKKIFNKLKKIYNNNIKLPNNLSDDLWWLINGDDDDRKDYGLWEVNYWLDDMENSKYNEVLTFCFNLK